MELSAAATLLYGMIRGRLADLLQCPLEIVSIISIPRSDMLLPFLQLLSLLQRQGWGMHFQDNAYSPRYHCHSCIITTVAGLC
jgi:hypothetical protein